MNTPESIDPLAARRAAGARSLLLVWKEALTSLPELPTEDLERIATHSPSPMAVRQLASFLSREASPAQAWKTFLRESRESEEPLDQWLAALATFALYTSQTRHRPSLSEALGYLHCCETVTHSGQRYETFPMTVETMLNTYGYDGGDPG